MKRLYNEYLALNQDGGKLDTGAYVLAKGFLDICENEDLDLRDGESVLVNAIHALFSKAILKRAVELRKAEKASRLNREKKHVSDSSSDRRTWGSSASERSSHP